MERGTNNTAVLKFRCSRVDAISMGGPGLPERSNEPLPRPTVGAGCCVSTPATTIRPHRALDGMAPMDPAAFSHLWGAKTPSLSGAGTLQCRRWSFETPQGPASGALLAAPPANNHRVRAEGAAATLPVVAAQPASQALQNRRQHGCSPLSGRAYRLSATKSHRAGAHG